MTPRELAALIGAPDDAVRIASWAKGGVMAYLRAYIVKHNLQQQHGEAFNKLAAELHVKGVEG